MLFNYFFRIVQSFGQYLHTCFAPMMMAQWGAFMPYALLIGAILFQFMQARNIFVYGMLSMALACGVVTHTVTGIGCCVLFMFGMSCFIFFHNLASHRLRSLISFRHPYVYNWIIMVGSLTAILGFKKNLFYSLNALSNVSLSPQSIPYSMNFDFGTTLAMILLGMGQSWYNKRKLDQSNPTQGSILFIFLVLFPAMILLTAVASLMAGYIQWDLKWVDHLGIWIIHNVFFICVPDEIFFRFFLQSQLKHFLPQSCFKYRLHMVLPAVAFGIAHGASPFYALFACIAGGFYGYVYERSQKIFLSILFHFLFNLCHILFFTYPASIVMLKIMR